MSAEDRKRFEQVDKRLEGMDANITDARSHIHRINDNIANLNDRVDTIEKDMIRHEEQTKANFADIRKDIKHARNYLILAIAVGTAIVVVTGNSDAVELISALFGKAAF